MTEIERLEHIINNSFNRWCRTGSYWMCNPPVTNTDIDYAVLPNKIAEGKFWYWDIPRFINTWDLGGSEPGRGEFESWRDGKFNIILFYNELEYEKFALASKIATERNLLNKTDRIALFEDVRQNYPKYCEIKEIEWV